jgi:lysophospholipase L1-like esterase
MVSLGLNAFLANATLEYVQANDAIHLDPAGLDVYKDVRSKPVESGPPVLEFFGDSRALMWSEPPPISGYRIINRGVGRQTTAQLLLRFDADVTAVHPALVVLEAGVNDLKTVAEFPTRRMEIIATCKANLTTIVDRCHRLGAEVVIVTVFDIGNVPLWRRPFWSADVEAAVREVNAFLPQLAGDRVVLFDANPALEAEPSKIKPEFQLDHLHIAPAGYAAINEKLVPFVSALPK